VKMGVYLASLSCSSALRTDFAPIDDVMRPNAKVQLTTIGGRSSNTNAFPFFNIEMPGEGVIVAIGCPDNGQHRL